MPSALQPREFEDLFALRLADDHEFRSWLLSRTKFAKLRPLARILTSELAAHANGDWWRNWSSSSATDGGVCVAYELEGTRLRFGIYFAVATQEADLHAVDLQRRRAGEQLSGERFMNMMDYETVLLAPQALVLDNRTLGFDRRIPFETVAGFVPEFGRVQRIAA